MGAFLEYFIILKSLQRFKIFIERTDVIMAKIYSNMQLISEPNDENDIIKKKNLTDALWKDVEEIIVDVPEHYELSTDGTGLTIVDDSVSPSVTEIKLSDVQAKILSTDTHAYAVGEMVILVDEQSHTSTHKEPIYAKREDIPEGSVTMSLSDWNDFSDNLVITASGYTE